MWIKLRNSIFIHSQTFVLYNIMCCYRSFLDFILLCQKIGSLTQVCHCHHKLQHADSWRPVLFAPSWKKGEQSTSHEQSNAGPASADAAPALIRRVVLCSPGCHEHTERPCVISRGFMCSCLTPGASISYLPVASELSKRGKRAAILLGKKEHGRIKCCGRLNRAPSL